MAYVDVAGGLDPAATWDISIALNDRIPAAVDVAVLGEPALPVRLVRRDPLYNRDFDVRNWDGMGGSGLDYVVDTEAPLGRSVTYVIIGADGTEHIESAPIYVPPVDGGALIRSVLSPWVDWLEITLVQLNGITYDDVSGIFDIAGQNRRVVVGEPRKPHRATATFHVPDLDDDAALLEILRPGWPILLRICPGASNRVRDVLFYAKAVQDEYLGNQGDRLVVVDYQAVDPDDAPGDTLEPPWGNGWDYELVRDAAGKADYTAVLAEWSTYYDLAVRPVLV